MRDAIRTSRVGPLVVVGVALVALASGAGPAAAVELGAFSGPIRFEAPDGVILDLGDRRYIGTIEGRVGPGGGVTIVDELSFDGYLEGLAEVPVSWPTAALQAQVIAARTYAWWELSQGVWTPRGYDICATQACQVFGGRDVAEQDSAGRWAAAVAATSRQVLVDAAGAPLLARYSSSNGGRSAANVEVFPDDGDWPYLQPVEDPHDAVSPFHRWQVRFPRADMNAILAQGETLAAAVPLADIRIVEVAGGEDLVEVEGQDGTIASVTASAFRFFVSREAAQLDGDAYPPPRADGSGRRQPATLLSSQIEFTVTDDIVQVDGRGFGHAVGMSQYGMLGKAEAGFDASQILSAYYGGITPTTPDALPSQVRVGMADDAEVLSVRPSGPVRVRVGDTVLTERALGDWRVTARPDRTLEVVAPEGYGAPLVVDPTTSTRDAPWSTEVIELETVVNKHVELEVEVRDEAGTVLSAKPAGIVAPGRHTVTSSLDGPGDALLTPGSYTVAVIAIDEEGERAGDATPVTVRAPTPPSTTAAVLASAPATPTRPTEGPLPLALVILAGGAAGALVSNATRRST